MLSKDFLFRSFNKNIEVLKCLVMRCYFYFCIRGGDKFWDELESIRSFML